jgi:hypothetical protein
MVELLLKEGASMRVRTFVLAAVAIALLVVPVATADSDQAVVGKTKGEVEWTIPPDLFGAEVGNDLEFKARKHADGSISGWIEYAQTFQGETFEFEIDVTCLEFYDGNRVKLGGLITGTNDPTLVGSYGWFQAFDLGNGTQGPADRSSLLGFGTEAANEAFCNSPNLPRFGPWDVDGYIKVKP